MESIVQYKKLFESYGGVMRTKELRAERVFYCSVQWLIKEGYITKIKTGLYRWGEVNKSDEIKLITKLFPDGVICRESALYIYGYLENKPSEWHIAVNKDSGKSRFQIDFPKVKPHYTQSKMLSIGMTNIEAEGAFIRIYDRERTLCDCIKYRNKLTNSIFQKVLKSYTLDTQKNTLLLLEYAEQLRVKKYTQNLVGAWN